MTTKINGSQVTPEEGLKHHDPIKDLYPYPDGTSNIVQNQKTNDFPPYPVRMPQQNEKDFQIDTPNEKLQQKTGQQELSEEEKAKHLSRKESSKIFVQELKDEKQKKKDAQKKREQERQEIQWQKLTERSLFIFDKKSSFRRFIFDYVGHEYFNAFIMVSIFLNSVLIAVEGDEEHNKQRNDIANKISQLFTAIYIFEAVLKIIAYGFFLGRETYLRRYINVFDFMIVLSSILQDIFTSTSNQTTASVFKQLRVLRVLKLFFCFYKVPKVAKQIDTILKAVKGLVSVALFLIFFFVTFSVMGLQLFSDDMYNACRLTPEPEKNEHGILVWEKAEIELEFGGGICSKTIGQQKVGGFACPKDTYCGSLLDHKMSVLEDEPQYNPQLYYNVAVWKNMGNSILAVFQIVTIDTWSNIMFNAMNSTEAILPFFYVFCAQMMGTWFLMILVLAVILVYFRENQEEEEDEDEVGQHKKKSLHDEEGDHKQKKHLEKEEDKSFHSISLGKSATYEEDKCGQVSQIYLQEESNLHDKKKDMNELSLYANVQNKYAASPMKFSVKNPDQSQETPFNPLKTSNKTVLGKKSGLRHQITVNLRKKLLEKLPPKLRRIQTLIYKTQDHIDNDDLGVNQRLRANILKIHLKKKLEEHLLIHFYHHLKEEKKAHCGCKHGSAMCTNVNDTIDKILDGTLHELQQEQEHEDSQQVNQNQKKYNLTDDLIFSMEVLQYYNNDFEKIFDDHLEIQNEKKELKEILLKNRKAEEDDKLENDLLLNERAKKSVIYQTCLEISRNNFFTLIMTLCIIGNTVLLALDRYPMSIRTIYVQEKINDIFYIIFLAEMFIQMMAQGLKPYFSNSFNSFDFVVIVISTVDFILQRVNINAKGINAIRALRVFRLLRVFKLARVWANMRMILDEMGKVIVNVQYLIIVVIVFIFSFAIISKSLFSEKMAFNEKNHPIPRDFKAEPGEPNEYHSPEFNFDNFMNSVISVFIFMAVDGWCGIFYNALRSPKINNVLATIFFLAMFIVGRLILFQLFLANMVEEFSVGAFIKDKTMDHEEETKSFTQKAKDFWALITRSKKIKSDDSVHEKPRTAEILPEKKEVPDRALCCLTKENKLRAFFIAVKDYKFGEDEGHSRRSLLNWIVWSAILISSIQLAFESPLFDQNTKLQKAQRIINWIMTFTFSLEIIVKIIAKGFFFNGPQSYLRKPSNVFDFIIVVTAIVDIAITQTTTVRISFLKIIRMFRLIRPMRIIFRNRTLTVTVNALAGAAPQLFHLLLVVLLCYAIFGIISVNIFKSQFYYCSKEFVIGIEKLEIKTKQDCINYGGEWLPYATNFDNTISAAIQIFIMAQTTRWGETMMMGIKSQGFNEVPMEHPPFGKNTYLSIFFICWMIFGAFFLQNLFVAVVVSQFNKSEEDNVVDKVLTAEQIETRQSAVLEVKVKPGYRLIEPTNQFRKFFFQIVYVDKYKNPQEAVYKKHKLSEKLKNLKIQDCFQVFIYLTILMNTVVLMIKWPLMSEKVKNQVEIVNYVCVGIFVVEAIIKLIAIDKKYFWDPWNIFDFCIVIGSIAFLSPQIKQLKKLVTVIRSFRIIRLIRLFKDIQELQVIYETIKKSWASLLNVGLLMLIIIYIFAVMGVQFFAEVKMSEGMNRFMNFKTFPQAFVTLYRTMNLEAWNEIMNCLSKQKSADFYCKVNPTYEDYVENEHETIGCGNRPLATIFFFVYFFMITIIFINIFVAIIIKSYETTNEKLEEEHHTHMGQYIHNFKNSWKNFDSEGTGQIDSKHFDALMKLNESNFEFGWIKDLNQQDVKKDQFKSLLKRHQNENSKLYFEEFLDLVVLLNAVIKLVKEKFKNKKEKEGMDFCEQDDELYIKNLSDRSPKINEVESVGKNQDHMNLKDQAQLKAQKLPQDIPQVDKTMLTHI